MKLPALLAAAAAAPLAAALWPVPSQYTAGNTTLWISSDVKITYYAPSNQTASQNSSSSTITSDQLVQNAIQRTHETIFDHVFVPWKFHPRFSDFEPSTSDKRFISSISLQQTQPDPAGLVAPLDDAVDESYSLTVPESGEVVVSAASSIGLLRGLTTFSQLFFKHSEGGSYTSLAPVDIQDAPKFAHRGLNMDVARNYFAVDDIKRMLDAMAFAKMNRFHLHITDSQSWPLVVPAIPDLSAKGAYAAGLVYTPEDLEDIQTYANLLGIEPILEIDMPGHTASIAFTDPDLIAAFNKQPDWVTYCAEPPCGTLKLNSSAVDDFLEKLLDDVLPRVQSHAAYFHSGGDEVNKNSYLLDDTVQSNSSEILQPLMQKFVDRNHDQIRANGLRPIVWEEMLLEWNLTLGSDVLVQTWQSDQAVADTVASGHKALAGNYNYWYLDCGKGQWLDFTPETASTYWPFNDYCSPRKNWRLMYSYDPLTSVPANMTHLVVGGECHIWAEQTDPAVIDSMVWPRAAAAAEVLWSGAKDEQGQNRSQITASPRLSDFRERLVARGIKAEPIQMPFCIQNGTQCAL